MKIAKEKIEINLQREEVKKQVEALQGKLKLLGEEKVKISTEEAKQGKVFDLIEKTGERKHLNQIGENYANTLLRERKAYVLVQLKKGPNDEDIEEKVEINGNCIRTPEEDIKWEEEQRELEAQANKKGGKAAP